MAFRKAKRIGFIACMAGLLCSATVSAQYYDSPGLGEKPVTTHPQDYKPLGIRAGGFMLHPGVQLAAQYTDNAFYSEDNLDSDWIYHVRPYINAQSTWSRHSLNIRLAADFAKYRSYSFRDYEDYFLQVSGQLDVRSRSYFTYAADYMNLHEGLNTRDSEQGLEPTRYDLYGLSAGYNHTFNRLTLGGQVSWRRFDFDNATTEDGDVIDNQDRDRDGTSWLLRASYQFATDMSVFGSYSWNSVSYDETFDRYGYSRDGDGYQASVGIARQVTGKIDASIFASYNDRSYDDPRLPNTTGWAAGGSLNWRVTPLTVLSGSITNGVQETTTEWASGYLGTTYQLRADHELLRHMQINGFLAYSDNDYQLIPGAPPDARASDQIYRAGIGASWFINRHAFLNASYAWEELKSNVPGDGYTTNTVWLVLGLER